MQVDIQTVIEALISASASQVKQIEQLNRETADLRRQINQLQSTAKGMG